MATAPKTYEDLRELLQEKLETLPQAQRRMAEVVLADPEGTAFRTIAETAQVANVHQSSLVRFARTLGLPGYPALVRLCREQLAEQAQLVRRFEEAEHHGDSGNFLNAVVEHDQQNLSRTFARIEPQEWDKAVRLLAESNAVHVMGARKCLAVAELMSYLLHLVRPDVHLMASPAGGLVDQLRDLQAGQAFVGISIRRYTADTIRAAQYAHKQGLQVIALTDDPASPLASEADVTFYIETPGVTILRSLVAFVSLVQALSTSVALYKGARTRAELLEDETLLQEFHVYFEHAEGNPKSTGNRRRRSMS